MLRPERQPYCTAAAGGEPRARVVLGVAVCDSARRDGDSRGRSPRRVILIRPKQAPVGLFTLPRGGSGTDCGLMGRYRGGLERIRRLQQCCISLYAHTAPLPAQIRPCASCADSGVESAQGIVRHFP